MKLVIDSQNAKVGINIYNASVNHKTTDAKLNIDTQETQIKIDSTMPKVLIDQSRCFSESGLKSNSELTADYAAKGVGKMNQGVARIVAQGNQLAQIGSNPIPAQAKYNAYDQFNHEFGLVTMPRSRPQVTLIEGKLNIGVSGDVKLDYNRGSVDAQYNPGKVQVYLEQKNYIKTKFEKTALDLKG